MLYLTAEQVANVNRTLTGSELLADPGLLASAVMRPQATAFGEDAYPTLWLKVAALFHSLCSNHAFVNANKRTAVISAINMLNLNGYELRAEQGDVVHLAVDAAEKVIDLEKIAEFFETHSRPLGLDNVTLD